MSLQHLRQLRAPSAARIVHVVREFLRTVGGDLIKPIAHLGIAAPVINEPLQGIAPSTSALVTSDSQHVSLPIRSAEMIAPSRGIFDPVPAA